MLENSSRCAPARACCECISAWTEIAVHRRQHSYGCSTNEAHMPRRHREHASWTPQRIQGWANTLGPEVSAWVRYQFEKQSTSGTSIPGLSGAAVAVAQVCSDTCREGLSHRQPRRKTVRRCDQSDRFCRTTATSGNRNLKLPQLQLPQQHDNVRGAKHFH